MTLVKYEQARAALEKCSRVDEAKDIRDKAEALRVYGRQANDHALEEWAAEIKFRAMRRMGEISVTLEKAKVGGAMNGKKGGKIELPPGGSSKFETLKAAGLSTQAASKCERIAAIPEKQFELVIAERKAAGKPVYATDVLRKVVRGSSGQKRKVRQSRRRTADPAGYARDLFASMFAELSAEWVIEADKKMMRALFRQFADNI